MKTYSIKRLALTLILALVAIVIWMTTDSSHPQKNEVKQKKASSQVQSIRKHLAQSRLKSSAVTDEPEPDIDYVRLTPRPMQLARKLLAQSKWNDGEGAFTREGGNEAATIGPSSVACDKNGNIYVLDTVKSRILGYDKEGTPISSVDLPSNVVSDLNVDPTDSSLLVFDHYNNKIYKVAGGQITLLGTAEMKNEYSFGTKFGFDAASGGLYAENQSGLADIQDGNLILKLKDGQKPLSIAFDKPVACVEETVTDAKGNIWALYTLEGDFRMRRLARIDPVRGTVGVAEVDVWFSFDGTRRMAATENGVVLVAGDATEGRLLTFDFAGGAL